MCDRVEEYGRTTEEKTYKTDFADIAGQENLKRAVEIAAAHPQSKNPIDIISYWSKSYCIEYS